MERIPINWVTDIPVVTRVWTIANLITSVLVDTSIVKLHDIIFVPSLISKQPWRIITGFLYMGHFDVNLIVALYLTVQYSRQLEESFERTRDYIWFWLVCASLLICYSTWCKNLVVLGSYQNEVLNYIWSKQNPDMMMGLLGLIEFRAGYLSFLLFFLNMITKSDKFDLWIEIPPLLIGHLVFYFEEVWRDLFGFNPLSPPWTWWR